MTGREQVERLLDAGNAHCWLSAGSWAHGCVQFGKSSWVSLHYETLHIYKILDRNGGVPDAALAAATEDEGVRFIHTSASPPPSSSPSPPLVLVLSLPESGSASPPKPSPWPVASLT